jgi:hypothetical protein
MAWYSPGRTGFRCRVRDAVRNRVVAPVENVALAQLRMHPFELQVTSNDS